MLSPDGIFVMQGDPDCPQTLLPLPDEFQGVMVPSSTGCTFLNIKPDAKSLASYYVKNVVSKRFGKLNIKQQRERPDIAATDLKATREIMPLSKSFRCLPTKSNRRNEAVVGRLYATVGYDPSQSLGFMTISGGTIQMWIAPPALQSVAEHAFTRMKNSFRITPNFNQIVQQDEMQIASNGAVANMNQQMWFQGQQAVHRAQVAEGDAIMQNYWQQQQVNDGIMQNYWNQQKVYDHASQNYSYVMLGNQRVYDDAMGKEYSVPAGANYYWLNQQGQIVGTPTSDPPDYQNNYTPLRKA